MIAGFAVDFFPVILQLVTQNQYIYRGVRPSVLSKSGGFGQTDLLLRLESEAPVHA